ncbi:MAG: exodeoxyribonuclease VII small subunit [Verrucomicrobiota bacterium]
MVKPVKDERAREGAAVNLPFEEALKRLESIVEAMEHDDLPLDTLLARYEEGTILARSCQSQLQAAELKIQELERNNAGQFNLKPFSTQGSPE